MMARFMEASCCLAGRRFGTSRSYRLAAKMPDARSRFHHVASQACGFAPHRLGVFQQSGRPTERGPRQKSVNWTNRCRCHSGSGRSHAIVLAMRYVIVIAAITFFLFWDGLYNRGHYLDVTVREVSRIVRYVTG
jgi:hypothetical protein